MNGVKNVDLHKILVGTMHIVAEHEAYMVSKLYGVGHLPKCLYIEQQAHVRQEESSDHVSG